jgi:lipopolysaccharide transport system permease protein
MLTSYIKLFVQVILLGILCLYYGIGYIQFGWKLLLIPVFLFFLGIFSTAIGIIISALTTKYRDLKFLTQFGVQLLMYGSAVVWPFELIQSLFSDKYQWLYDLALFNPLIHFIEGFRHILFGEGFFDPFWFLYSSSVSIVMFILGLLIFTRVEKDFMDTI